MVSPSYATTGFAVGSNTGVGYGILVMGQTFVFETSQDADAVDAQTYISQFNDYYNTLKTAMDPAAMNDAQTKLDEAKANLAEVSSGDNAAVIKRAKEALEKAQADADAADASYADAQNALDKAQADAAQAQSELTAATEAKNQADEAVATAKADVAAKQAVFDETDSQLKAAQAAYDKAQAELDHATNVTQNLDDIIKTRDELQAKLPQLQQAADDAKAALEQANEDLESKVEALNTATTDLDAANKALADATARYDATLAVLASAKDTLADVNALREAYLSAQDALAKAQAEYDDAVSQLAPSDAKLAQLKDALIAAQDRVAQTYNKYFALYAQYMANKPAADDTNVDAPGTVEDAGSSTDTVMIPVSGYKTTGSLAKTGVDAASATLMSLTALAMVGAGAVLSRKAKISK